jgi:sugar phosphate isomerase/epimerase
MPRMKSLLCAVLATSFLLTTTAIPALAGPRVGTGKHFKGPVGLQLYSLRDEFKKGVRRTLDRVRDYGFRYVELAGTYGWLPRDFRAALLERGLVPVAGHFSYERWRDEPELVVRDAKALGLKYAGCAWIPHQGDFDYEECLEAARVFNRAGELAALQGIRFFYHNHGYEFQPHGDGTLLDLLFEKTNPKFVAFEMDLLWTVHPGQDPVKWLEKYPKRWELMHLKDLKKGVVGDLSGGTDVRNDVVLGTGQMDFPAILKAAKKAGIKYYFIEDESPWVVDQIPQSLRFLERVDWE